MKQISKGDPPKVFSDWVAKEKPRSWDDLHTSKSKPVYEGLVVALRAEQGNLCCYCEQELHDGKTHVEHFHGRPNPKLAYDYGNLHASCNGDKSKCEDKHCCGHRRAEKQKESYGKLVSPLDGDVELRFKYDEKGEMQPTKQDDGIAQSTIDILGLNCEKLKRLRQKTFLDIQYQKPTMTDTDFVEWIRRRLEKNSDDHFSEFWTVVDFFFGSRATL
ncbi:MAG TPA: TIGR02646 family protein [Planctomycetaceae bacterium]|nr:TIGR02646 family protein [Planctomycetaceae bacterium]